MRPARVSAEGLEVVGRKGAANVGVRTHNVIIAKKIVMEAGVQCAENGVEVVAAALPNKLIDIELDYALLGIVLRGGSGQGGDAVAIVYPDTEGAVVSDFLFGGANGFFNAAEFVIGHCFFCLSVWCFALPGLQPATLLGDGSTGRRLFFVSMALLYPSTCIMSIRLRVICRIAQQTSTCFVHPVHVDVLGAVWYDGNTT